MKTKKSIKFSILLLSVILCLTMSSCLTIPAVIIGGIGGFLDALDTGKISNRQTNYNVGNDLAVTFSEGKMYAIWDANHDCAYSVSVEFDKATKSYDETSEAYSSGSLCLSDLGYDYSQDLTVTLKESKKNYVYPSVKEKKYSYKGLTEEQYDKYASPVKAGFSEIDYYAATRKEFFDLWSYLIVFREDAKTVDGCYEVESDVYMAYDYKSLYRNVDYSDAFAFEVYSAIDAYEDSAAYNYSFEMGDNGVEGTVYMKFYYPTSPSYISDSWKEYTNATTSKEKAHYRKNDTDRNFAIDSVQKTIPVSSSDQLYFAMKFGYRPVPVQGSNAELLYNRMRDILSVIVIDSDTVAVKAHYVYDYIIDTVVYDYDFTENVYNDESLSTYQLFSYSCLYMEGVFGLNSSGEFEADKCVAICDGLSKAYLCMLRIEGIECIKISGTVDDEGHAWNKVKIGGNWYLVDTTWGNSLDSSAKKEYLSHKYILVADDSSHEESAYRVYPSADSVYNFGSEVNNQPGSGSGYFPFNPLNPRL